jgi:hypothetical protein
VPSGSHPSVLPWIGKGRPRSARPAMKNKPLRQPEPVMETGRDQKSPVRRCFKPRPPLRTGCAGFASGCRSSVRGSNDTVTSRSSRSHSGRLSGLLSGCPPIDTRPQARAKLGKRQISDLARLRKVFCASRRMLIEQNESGEIHIKLTRDISATAGSAVRLAALRERLDLHAGAHELRHHVKTKQEKEAL